MVSRILWIKRAEVSVINSVKAFLVIGGAQVANMVISILRVKIIAVMMGPYGIGVLGLFNSFKDSFVNIAHLGIPNSGVKTISQAQGDTEKLAEIQSAIFLSLFIQGAISMLVIWAMKQHINSYIFDHKAEAWHLAVVGFSVWMILTSASIITTLQGLRRVSEIAKVTVYGSLIGTILGLSFVFFYREQALALFVFSLALGQLIAGVVIISKSRDIIIPRYISFKNSLRHWLNMSKLGVSIMLSGMTLTLTMLLMRAYFQKTSGFNAVGQFEAAWVLSITYLAFILNTMAADYYPKLSSIINDNLKVKQTVNNHLQLIIVLSGPLIIVMIGFAPWLVGLLYTNEFSDSGVILQWFMVGNFFKLLCLTYSYILLAKGAGGLFLLLEICFSLCFAFFSWLQFSEFSVIATGPAYLTAYIIQICILYCCIIKLVKFKLDLWTKILKFCYLVAIVFVMFVAQHSPLYGACFSSLFFMVGLIIGFRFLITSLDSSNPLVIKLKRYVKKN